MEEPLIDAFAILRQHVHDAALAVGDVLPDMPLFLSSELNLHVPVPLETTYEATWAATPEEFRVAVETGVLPSADAE